MVGTESELDFCIEVEEYNLEHPLGDDDEDGEEEEKVAKDEGEKTGK